MNSIVDNIYVINMKKDVIKLNTFKQQCDSLFKYQLVEGVDISSNYYKTYYDKWKLLLNNNTSYDTFDWVSYLNKYEDLRNAGIKNKKTAWIHYINNGKSELRSCNRNIDIVSLGQVGCLLSHINILKDAINNNYDKILILEDDIIISKSFTSRLHEINSLIQDDWNIIYLGVSQHNWDNIHINDNIYNADKSTGSFAYMVHNSFYQTLLNTFEKMNKPVDNYLVQLQESNYFKVIYPNIIYCDLENSNISAKRLNKEWFKKFRWD